MKNGSSGQNRSASPKLFDTLQRTCEASWWASTLSRDIPRSARPQLCKREALHGVIVSAKSNRIASPTVHLPVCNGKAGVHARPSGGMLVIT